MTTADTTAPENHSFEAEVVAKLLHLMVHSVIFRQGRLLCAKLISNAADACEKLRYEAISHPALFGDDPKPRITLLIDADNRRLTVEDNGIGLSRDEMIEALGTIARSGTKAFMERIQAPRGSEGAQLIGQFRGSASTRPSWWPIGSTLSHAERGARRPTVWSSDGKGSYTVAPAAIDEAPTRGTRVILPH